MTPEQPLMTIEEKPPLSRYLGAVLKRKPLIEKMSGQAINHAILRQLQDDDVPRLVKIIWALHDGRRDEADALAKAGNTARWGEYVPTGSQPRFRKRPVIVDAFRWDGPDTALPGWMAGKGWAITEDQLQLAIPTLEGVMHANRGDWVIQGVKGEVYPCKPDIFAATYEPA